MQIQPSTPVNQPAQVRISKRALEQVMRVNPKLAAGRSLREFKDYLEQGGSMQFGGAADAPAAASFAHTESEPQSNPQTDLEHAVGFFVKSQAHEAESTLAELEIERRRIEAAMDATRARAEDKIKSFLGMLDPMAVAQFGRGAVAQHKDTLDALGINSSTLLNL